METYAKALLVAIPVFSVLVLFEAWYGRKKDVQSLHHFDTISSLSSGITNVIKDSLGVVILIVSYPWILGNLAVFTLEATVPVYVLGFLAVDFAGYWSHRLNHRVNFFWNNHVIHHSSEEFNLACALRQSISNILGIYALFLVPAAVFGVPAQVINLIAPVHLFLQFWYHTRHIPKLGWLEYVIITPSQHRVHHAINSEYMDKNLGQIFTWWDRLFGTFQEELETVPPVYGITRPARTWNPVLINFQHVWLLTKDAWRTQSYFDKLRIWFMPTGWRPPDVVTRYPVFKIDDVYHFQKYGARVSAGLIVWSWFQFLATIGLLVDMLARFGEIGVPDLYYYGAFIFAAVYGFTTLMDRHPIAAWLETVRGLLGVFWIFYSGSWFGINEILVWIVVLYFMVTVCGVWFFAPERAPHQRYESAADELAGRATNEQQGDESLTEGMFR